MAKSNEQIDHGRPYEPLLAWRKEQVADLAETRKHPNLILGWKAGLAAVLWTAVAITHELKKDALAPLRRLVAGKPNP